MSKRKVKTKAKRLNKKEVQSIIEEKTAFEITLSLEHGLEVQEKEDGTTFVMVEEEEVLVAHDEVVTINFNHDVLKRISKYINTALAIRGIKDVDGITETDPDVRKLVANWKKRIGKKFVSNQEQNVQARRYVETVKREHRPHFIVTFAQVMAWGLIYDDVFTVKKGAIDVRLDIEVKPDYWDGNLVAEENDGLDALDAMLDDYVAPEVVYDQSNPLEVMLAITTTLLDENPELGTALEPYYQKVYAAIQVNQQSRTFDDAGFLRTTLDELLSKSLDDDDDFS
jgi:hypothetical protein